MIWEEFSGKQNQSQNPLELWFCTGHQREKPPCSGLRSSQTPATLSVALSLQPAAQRRGHATVGGRSVPAGGGNGPAHGPTVRKHLRAQPLAGGVLSPWLSFKMVLRKVTQRPAEGPGKASGRGRRPCSLHTPRWQEHCFVRRMGTSASVGSYGTKEGDSYERKGD